MGREVDGDTLDGFWDALTDTEPFTVCYDEMFNACYNVPGWDSWEMFALVILELVLWFVALRWTWKKVMKRGKRNTEPLDEDRDNQGQGGRLGGGCSQPHGTRAAHGPSHPES